MKKSILFFCFSIFLLNWSYAQKRGQERVDSLLTELPKAGEDTIKVRILYYLSSALYAINPDEGINYGLKGLELANTLNWKKGIADISTSIGVNYWAKSDYPNALEHYYQALKVNEELNDKKGIAANINNIALIYQTQSELDKALEFYFKALKQFEELNNRNGIAATLGNIGTIYEDQSDYAKALEYYNKSLQMNEENGSRRGIALNLGNIGLVYKKESHFTKALTYLFRSLSLYQEIGDQNGIATNLENIGEAYYAISGEKNNAQLVELFKGDKIAALKQAKIYSDSAIIIFKELGSIDDLKVAYKNLSEIQEALGDFKSSLNSYKNFTACKDSIFNESKNSKIASLEAKRAQELNQKQLEIKDLQIRKEKSEKRYFIGGIFLLLCLTGLLYNGYRLKNNANIIINSEKKRSDDLLLNILPGEVAEELKEQGKAKAKSFESVTVMFTDFKDFTLLGERMSPEQLVTEINFCFSVFDNIIGKYGIEKIKTIGDAYMCAGGIPVKNDSHARDVVSAALEIRDFMEQHKNEKLAKGETPFEIRIGINTGPVVAGIVGVKKFAYDIWGDTVNKASRMESSSQAGKVNVSGSTYALIKNDFNFTYRGKIEAKNNAIIEMYFVEPK